MTNTDFTLLPMCQLRVIYGEWTAWSHILEIWVSLAHLGCVDGLTTCTGQIEDDGNWLMQLVADIQVFFEAADANDTEFSLLSVNHEPGTGPSQADQLKATRLKEDWGPFIVHMLKLHAEKEDLEMLMD